MSVETSPTAYDRLQNRWIWVAIMFWAVSMGVAMLMTADIVGYYLREEVNELRERVAIMEHEKKAHEDSR